MRARACGAAYGGMEKIMGTSEGATGSGRHRAFVAAALAVGLLVGTAAPARALTPLPCLATKVKAWGNLRKCQAIENGKALQGKVSDPGKCQTTLDAKLATLDHQAQLAGFECRWIENADGTWIDLTTGLQWEIKTDDTSAHDKDNTYSWTTNPGALLWVPDGTVFTGFLGALDAGGSPDGGTTTGCFAGACDWRLPTVGELVSISDGDWPNLCPHTPPCTSIPGPTTLSAVYWSSSLVSVLGDAYHVHFSDGEVDDTQSVGAARAVRRGL